MNYNEYKAKAFAERPEVKAEYDALGPQYEIIQIGRASCRERV